jgi:hypothetical protein
MIEIKLRDFARPMSMEKLYAMMNWCEDNFGTRRDWRGLGGRWSLDGTKRFMFTHNEDAVLFTLRWS